jgi:hypothetical protein
MNHIYVLYLSSYIILLVNMSNCNIYIYIYIYIYYKYIIYLYIYNFYGIHILRNPPT